MFLFSFCRTVPGTEGTRWILLTCPFGTRYYSAKNQLKDSYIRYLCQRRFAEPVKRFHDIVKKPNKKRVAQNSNNEIKHSYLSSRDVFLDVGFFLHFSRIAMKVFLE